MISEKNISNSIKHYYEVDFRINGEDSAKTYLNAVYSLLGIYAQIPILRPFFSQMLKRFKGQDDDIVLLKSSLENTKNFFDLRIASISFNAAQMKSKVLPIFENCFKLIERFDHRSVSQAFEAEPYITLGNSLELYSLFDLKKNLVPMAEKAIRAFEILKNKDVTNDKRYQKLALEKISRLKIMLKSSEIKKDE